MNNDGKRKKENGPVKSRRELELTTISEDEAREYAESIINTVREPLIAPDHELRVVTVSRSFYDVFEAKPEETVGQLIYDLGNKQLDIPRLRELLETILPLNTTFDKYEVEHDFSTVGRRIMPLNARQIRRGQGKERIILLAIEDITERKQAEETAAFATEHLVLSIKELEQFDYSVSHDLRAPLLQIAGFTDLLEKCASSVPDEKSCRYLNMIEAAAGQGVTLIDEILDYSQLRRANIITSNVNVKELVQEVVRDIQNGSTVGPKEVVCFVRDNGVGFEMERQGGCVWAEGAPDKGATFYFSLPHQRGGIEAVTAGRQSDRAHTRPYHAEDGRTDTK